MEEKTLILSDIHGNLTALNRILERAEGEPVKNIILLGDLIDYGPRSNEVLERLDQIPKEKICVNLWGNHEHAIMTENYGRFSSDRGRQSAQYTRRKLTAESIEYLTGMNKDGRQEFLLGGKKCLAVHASLEDVFWKSIDMENISDDYSKYDYVFSGHSHIAHYMQKFYKSNHKEYRYLKRTVFINPGSVGQPRNHSPAAQAAIFNATMGSVEMLAVEYDVEAEMKLFPAVLDSFYKERLKKGI